MKMTTTTAFGKDSLPLNINFDGNKKEQISKAKKLKKDMKISYAEIITLDRCTCGCGGAHEDKIISREKI